MKQHTQQPALIESDGIESDDVPAWDGVLCQICFKPFTARTWDERHTIPAWHNSGGEDCHAHCCPHPACRDEREQAQRLRTAEIPQP